MIVQFQDGGGAVKLAEFSDWALVYVQVRGASAIRLSNQKPELETSGIGGQPQGYIVSAGGEARLWWKGSLYGIQDGPGAMADVQFIV